MKLQVYNDIISQLHSYDKRIKIQDISSLFPSVPVKTLGSIYSQDYQRKMKRVHHLHYNSSKMDEYYIRFFDELSKQKTNIMLRMAHQIDLSPALLARIVLDRYLAHSKFDGESPPKTMISQMMKDTSLLDHPELAFEIRECVLSDEIYGPLVDSVKHSVGLEYEFLLQRYIEEKGLSYLGEDQLRTKGYDKTPDFKLEVPIAVDGFVVNWIESKASFGDEASHKNYLKEQFWSYWNRFGPGLVIYWFGFIEELDTTREKGILLMDHFPEKITLMDPGVLDSHSTESVF